MDYEERFTAAELGQGEERSEMTLRPQKLEDYIGQKKATDNLKIFIEAAKLRKEPLDHVLFYGPPGLGKTTLAGIISNEMGVDIRITSGPAIERAGDLAAILTNLNENDVLFIDAMMPTFNPEGMPSMRQDVLAKRPTEVEEFAGVVRQRAKKYGMPTPANDFFYTRIREIEAGYDQ